jgi:hypothetical protein
MRLSELFVQALRASLKECEEADDQGTVDRVMGDWQVWVKTWPQIFDENGGI